MVGCGGGETPRQWVCDAPSETHLATGPSAPGFFYVVSPDAKRFLVLAPTYSDALPPVTVMTNWLAMVKR